MTDHGDYLAALAQQLADMDRCVAFNYELEGVTGECARDWHRALVAVVELHRPAEEGGTRWCESCTTEWPCRTIRVATGKD